MLRWLVALGAATVLITEALSPFGLLQRGPVAVAWCLTLPVLVALRPLRFPVAIPRPSWFPACAVAAIAGMSLLVGWTAGASPPNSADTMSYHLPRVLHWMQNGSVRFFPSSYLNLIMMQPAAEYLMLHAYLLTGSDALSNFFAFAAWIGCIAGVSCTAALLGLDAKAQAVAALFCATLPNGILQASGAKNDIVLACFLVCAIVFAMRWRETENRSDAVCFALAVGLACCTKGTAYLFAPAVLAAILPVRMCLRATLVAFAGICLLNGPQFARNMDLSGSPLGADSAHGDGLFRWRVDHFGWKPLISSLLRNTSEQLGSRSEAANQRVYQSVIAVHRWLGIDPQDPSTTWRWAEYGPPTNSNHEANANNRWHLLIFVLALLLCRGQWLRYAAGVIAGFLVFSFYLRWQPYFGRLELPLFVMMAPVAAMAIARIPVTCVQVLICLVLLSNSRLALVENWTRPLSGPRSLLRVSRNQAYFNDVGQWNNRDSYLGSVEATAATGCSNVGIDTSLNHVQYPYEILLRQRLPSVRFTEVGVTNASAKYADPNQPKPCVVFCPDCLGKREKVEMYRETLEHMEVFGRFLVFSGTKN